MSIELEYVLISCPVIRREILQEASPFLGESICAYRGGYIAEVGFFLSFYKDGRSWL